MKNNLAEYKLVDLWRDLISREDTLVTENGEPLRVIYPGRLNDDRGADFRDAVIMRGSVVQQGDIELHVKSGDWESHGHNRNPAYNSVILHVVLQENGSLTMHRANGELIPTLSLNRYLEKRLQPATAVLPCSGIAKKNPLGVVRVLDEAGEARFRQKAVQFQEEVKEQDAGQVLYRGILGALGYSKNKIPCLKVADMVPLAVLESLTQGFSGDDLLLRQQALLLGTAGLLPAQRFGERKRVNDEYVNALEELWAGYSGREILPPSSWNLFKVRPNNSPLRRIAGLSYFICRYQQKGLSVSLMDLVAETPVKNIREITQAFTINTDGYWAEHYDFGIKCSQLSPSLIGSDRAGEIIVNVLLPFVFNQGLMQKALEMFRNYPALPPNSIEKHLQRQLGLNGNALNTPCRRQGLIHIYKTLCTQGKCMECDLSKNK